MATRRNTVLLRRSNTAGVVPTAGQLQLGEVGINTADVKLYASGTTTNSILPIGWDRVARTGDTMTGALSGTSLTLNTLSGITGTSRMVVVNNIGTLSATTIPSVSDPFPFITRSTSYTATATDYLIRFTALTGSVSVLLTSGSTIGKPLIIKDESGSAGTFNITVSGTIDNVVNKTISAAYGVLRLYRSTTTKWSTF